MLGKNLLLETVLPQTQGMTLGPLSVGTLHADTLVLSWTCMAGALLGLSLMTRKLAVEGPGGDGQGVVEMLYGFLRDLTKGQIGHDWRIFLPLIAGIFIFVLTANFIGIGPWTMLEDWFKEMHWVGVGGETFEVAAPTTDVNVPLGLAAIAILTYLTSGFWKAGAGYLKTLLVPPTSLLEWLDLLIRPTTLTLRLMLVITADELLRAVALSLVPVLLPVAVMGFEYFISVIQAFVFAVLTSIYVGLTLSHAEHH
jgi:F-type H+-transporting ATPase subunit a